MITESDEAERRSGAEGGSPDLTGGTKCICRQTGKGSEPSAWTWSRCRRWACTARDSYRQISQMDPACRQRVDIWRPARAASPRKTGRKKSHLVAEEAVSMAQEQTEKNLKARLHCLRQDGYKGSLAVASYTNKTVQAQHLTLRVHIPVLTVQGLYSTMACQQSVSSCVTANGSSLALEKRKQGVFMDLPRCARSQTCG